MFPEDPLRERRGGALPFRPRDMNHVELVEIRGGVSDSGEVVVHLWDGPFQHPSARLAYGLDTAAISERFGPAGRLARSMRDKVGVNVEIVRGDDQFRPTHVAAFDWQVLSSAIASYVESSASDCLSGGRGPKPRSIQMADIAHSICLCPRHPDERWYHEGDKSDSS